MKEQLEQLIQELNLNGTTFAKEIGVRQNRISTFRTGHVKFPRIDIIVNTKRRFPQVNLNALFGYEGPLVFSEEEMDQMEKEKLSRLTPAWEKYVEAIKEENTQLKGQIEAYQNQVASLHKIIEKLQS